MGLFQFVKIGSFQSGDKKQKAQEILAKEGIFYKIKVKSSLKMNSFDSAVLGNKYNPIEKMTYFLSMSSFVKNIPLLLPMLFR